jgi:hypothetical protein
VHHFIISAVSLPSKSHCDAFFTKAHYARVGGLAPSKLACLECAFLAAIDWRLACTCKVLQLYYVNLVAHSGDRFYLLSSSSSNFSTSSTAAANTNTNDPSSSTGSTEGTPGNQLTK